RLDVPDRREAGVIGGRRAAKVPRVRVFRERQRRRVACPAVAVRRLPGVARRGRSTIRVTKRCVDRTRTPVPAECWGRSHPSRHRVGPLAAGPGPELAATAQARNVALQFYPVRESKDLDDAFAARSGRFIALRSARQSLACCSLVLTDQRLVAGRHVALCRQACIFIGPPIAFQAEWPPFM